jgi:RimJ/RimL family protein N-acetyltransferase
MVRIRPLAEAELALAARLSQDADDAGPFGFFGFRDPGRLRREFAENGLLTSDRGTLAVALAEPPEAGEFLGDVSWRRVPTAPSSHTWNIGIGLLASARGHGYGTTAQRLLAEYLFAHTQANRVEASTETANAAERRALEKAGFTFEGVLRGACFRGGQWRDMACYAMVRSDLT